jgi:hypothetical protein
LRVYNKKCIVNTAIKKKGTISIEKNAKIAAEKSKEIEKENYSIMFTL